jgi:hypothetical protein
MTILKGVILVGMSCILGAVGGGLTAVGLNRVAPGYYPGVFRPWPGDGARYNSRPRSVPAGQDNLLAQPDHIARAVHVGVASGVLQGLFLGFLVGTVLALILGWFGRLQVMEAARALAIVLLLAAITALGGAGVGYVIGCYGPGYYRVTLRNGGDAHFDPVDVGIGLGGSQGAVVGVLAGVVLVVLYAWRSWGTWDAHSWARRVRSLLQTLMGHA